MIGVEHKETIQLTDQQYLAARKKYLIGMRIELGWSAEQMAHKLQITLTEYEAYEEGRSRDLEGLDFEDIKFYLHSHLKALEVV
jgi:DNA-binding XRE family transcriptional regulator